MGSSVTVGAAVLPMLSVALRRFVGNGQLAAGNRLNAGVATGLGEFQRTEQIVGVGHGDGWHPEDAAAFDQIIDFESPFKKRICGVDVKVNEFRYQHAWKIPRVAR